MAMNAPTQATDAKMGGYGQFLCSRGKSLS